MLAAGLIGFAASAQAADLDSLPDPTRPFYGAAAGGARGTAGSALQSTFVSASQRRAVINGRTYKVGDKYGGGTIADIQPYEVVLKHSKRETRLRLLPQLAQGSRVVKVPASSREEGKE